MHKNLKNLTSKRFGKLIVVKICDIRGNGGEVLYDCVCDCGNEKQKVFGVNLSSGKVNSCGCLLKNPPNKNQNRKVALIKKIYSSMRSSGRSNLKGFNLNFDDFCNLIFSNCYYCGQLPSNTIKDYGNNGLISHVELKYNGIDRKNNSVGYTKNNCVSCCKVCNFCKCSLSHEAFINQIRKIHSYLHL